MNIALPTQNELKPLIVIAGPTAVGKSAVAVGLAENVGGEIVTADSMQIYRGLDIATDKPTPSERRGIPHHMIDILEPDQSFNVVRYRDMAREVIADIHGRSRIPILAGGTGLYMKAVLDDFLFPDHEADPELRKKLEQEAEERGGAYLHDQLRQIDPVTAKRLHPNDVRRVIRAIEVFMMTGETLSSRLASLKGTAPRYKTAMVALDMPREALYARINQRVDEQIQRGLLKEVERLVQQYDELPVAGQSIGIKEMIPVVHGTVDLATATETLKTNSRRYAKRQWTWFRRDHRFTWFDMSEFDSIDAAVQRIAKHVSAELGGDAT